MTEEIRQQVVDTDDDHLRRLIHEHLKVFGKFTSDNCETCEALAPPFTKFVDDPINVSYCQGRLLECDALTTEAEVVAQLERLRAFAPVAG
jgi:thioredoxin 1